MHRKDRKLRKVANTWKKVSAYLWSAGRLCILVVSSRMARWQLEAQMLFLFFQHQRTYNSVPCSMLIVTKTKRKFCINLINKHIYAYHWVPLSAEYWNSSIHGTQLILSQSLVTVARLYLRYPKHFEPINPPTAHIFPKLHASFVQCPAIWIWKTWCTKCQSGSQPQVNMEDIANKMFKSYSLSEGSHPICVIRDNWGEGALGWGGGVGTGGTEDSD